MPTTWQGIRRDGIWLILPDSLPRRVLCEARLKGAEWLDVAIVKQEAVKSTTYGPAKLILALLADRKGEWQWLPLAEAPIRAGKNRPAKKRKKA